MNNRKSFGSVSIVKVRPINAKLPKVVSVDIRDCARFATQVMARNLNLSQRNQATREGRNGVLRLNIYTTKGRIMVA
jgi:hypothetical protein